MKNLNEKIEETRNRIREQKGYEERLIDELTKAYETDHYVAANRIRRNLNSIRSLIMQLSGKLNELIRKGGE